MATTLTRSTRSVRVQDAGKQRVWYVMDAANRPLGRLAVDAARILRGKHKPTFTPHVDTGDYVIIVNAEKVALTGLSKPAEEVRHHTGWPGALKSIRRQDELARKPEAAIRRVVRGMLPHNRLGNAMIKKLKVYRGPDHPHAAQNPIPFTGGVQKSGQ
ncbi:MAG: 50S ribosomal protein L13 [Chloroherpetonaceae bacterium]|nr:50S ribosomal protein L13 [Chthonomonadaceae bacterium]MDW8207974.1 50S ribosomal protein L13 [Chloroherpetonaceae bacterium]